MLPTLLLAASLLSAATAAGPVVNTKCGPVLGSYYTLYDGSGTAAAFRSIRYAASPERWSPPVAAACWDGTYNATEFQGYCVQPGGDGVEDCLFLHVYVPVDSQGNLPSPTASLPVLAYIHGGGLMGGSGNFEMPATFAYRTGTIAVAINYRLNVFGYLATAALSSTSGGTSGNYGFLDQQLALRWIQNNIRAFGGDPTRVTLAGQSSGGTSIFALLSSPASVGLFSGAIALSGSPNMSMTLQVAHVQNAGVPVALGCSNADPATEVACMRQASVSALLQAMPGVWNTPHLWSLDALTPEGMGQYYGGLPIVDGVVLASSFEDAMAAGLVDVPFIIGGMGQECEIAPGNNVRGETLPEWRANLTNWLAAWGNDAPALTDDVYNTYLADAQLDVQRAYDTFNTDYGVLCGFIRVAAGAKAGKYKSPVYVYSNSWQPSVPVRGGSRDRIWCDPLLLVRPVARCPCGCTIILCACAGRTTRGTTRLRSRTGPPLRLAARCPTPPTSSWRGTCRACGRS